MKCSTGICCTVISGVAALFASVGTLAAGTLPETAPEEVGISSLRLERLTRTMQQLVDNGELAGMVVMIARKGKLVYQRSFGSQDKAKGVPMAPIRSSASTP